MNSLYRLDIRKNIHAKKYIIAINNKNDKNFINIISNYINRIIVRRVD